MADEDLKDIIVTTFLQGSYRRSTAVRPKQGKRSDVDIVVVTKLDKEELSFIDIHLVSRMLMHKNILLL